MIASKIPAEEYDAIRKKLVSLTGIELGESKQVLVVSRLQNRLTSLQLKDYSQYLHFLTKNPNEATEFINCLTTNKTDWFREPTHFEYLTESALPYLKPTGPIYLWSAASSTGEEVYSLAMTMTEKFPTFQQFGILGTDIDTEALQHAMDGMYRKDEVLAQVPALLQKKYFESLPGEGQKTLSVRSEVQEKIKFRQFNLLKDRLPSEIQFDAIFLRNVLIYFSPETIEKVIQNVCRYLKKDGCLFIGHTESLSGLDHPLTQVSESVYRLKG